MTPSGPEVGQVARCRKKYGPGQLFSLLDDCGHDKIGVFVQTCTIAYRDKLFQRPQQMSHSFATAGYLVLYLSILDDLHGYEQVFPNVFLARDFEDGRDVLGPVKHLKGAIISFYSTVNNYIFEAHLACLRERDNFLIYELVDAIDEKIAGIPVGRLLKNFDFVSDQTFDLVVVTAAKLASLVTITGKVPQEKILYSPNAVCPEDYASRTKVLPPSTEERKIFDSLRKPIVGYFGAIAPWLWYDMLKELSISSPEYDFVYIGPDFGFGVSHLFFASNVYYIGAVSHEELPYYASRFSVAIIPFAPGPIAASTSPLKIFEYFALRKPVIATSFMDECTKFDVVFHASTAEGFKQQIDKAMKVREDEHFLKKLDALVKENTWDERVRDIIEAYNASRAIPEIYTLRGTRIEQPRAIN